MHKSFIITEEDRNRILGMHENATKRQYLNEATEYDYAKDWAKETDKGGANKLISASRGAGTDEEMLMNGFKEIKNFQETEEQLKRIWSHAAPDEKYSSIEDMLKGEMDSDGESRTFLENLKPILSKLGYSISYNTLPTTNELIPNTIKITKGSAPTQTSTQTWKPELENCVKASGAKKDEQGTYWLTNKDGKWGFYSDGRYHKEGSNNWGYYYCNGNKIAYSKTQVKPGETPKTETQQPVYKIPPQLSNKDGVIKFQTWMETNYKGWYKGNKPTDGKFGKQTNAAWTKYGSEYMLNPNKGKSVESVKQSTQQTTPTTQQNVGPLAPTPGLTFPNLPQK